MIEDGSEAALHRAGGDDPQDVPPAGGDVPHGEAAPAVARAGGPTGVTEAGTELVRLRPGGARLSGANTGGQYRNLDCLQTGGHRS